MIPKYLSAIGSASAPAMGNHLWQSTLCLVIAGLLTLLLRKNHARVRYGLWLAASVKFLIPFSLLIVIGSHLAKPRLVGPTELGFFYAMEQISQPFTPPAARVIPPVVHSTTFANLFPAIVVAMWFCGFVVVLFVWGVRWHRISAVLGEAVLLGEGREVDALHRVERRLGIRKPIDLFLSPATLEPGIFGIVKPALVWPKGISARLDNAQLEAILAHEVCHVRRRDNLTAAIHMVVEAVFWFHPLVWWLGSRLLDERERACDEEVLEAGSDRQVYAESILKTCEFCVESPLACVSGVTGADLKNRITRIMTERMANKLSFGRKLVLATIGLAAVAGPVVFGVLNAPAANVQAAPANGGPLPSFEVATIKLNRSGEPGYMIDDQHPARFQTRNATMKALVEYAYQTPPAQILGGPDWFDKQPYNVEAKIADAQWDQLEKLTRQQRVEQTVLMLRSLLEDRCHLTLHRETREMKIYALVVAKNGPKLLPAGTFSNPNDPANPHRDGKHHSWSLFMTGASMWQLAHDLPSLVGRPVVDRTGLSGTYDLALDRATDLSGPTASAAMKEGPDANAPGPSIFTMIQEQLGLKLEPTKGPVEVLVIDHIERPSEN